MNDPSAITVQENLSQLQKLARRMRQKEAVGSLEDELLVLRAVVDISELLTLVASIVQRNDSKADSEQGVQPN